MLQFMGSQRVRYDLATEQWQQQDSYTQPTADWRNCYLYWFEVLGNHWLKLLPCPGMSCMSYLTTRAANKETNWENSGGAKRKEEPSVHIFCQPPRILLSGLYLGWEICTSPRRILSQTKYGPSKITDQRQPRYQPHYNTWDWATRQSSFPEFVTLLLSTQAPLSSKVFYFVSTCVSSDSSFLSVKQKPMPGHWKGSPSSTKLVLEGVRQRGQLCPSLQLSQYVSL